MKKKYLVFLCLMTMVFVTACGNKNKDVKKEDLKEYVIEDSKQFDVMEIKYNGKVYRPFAAAKPSDADTIIGYYKQDGEYNSVYTLKDTKSDNWIVDVMSDVNEEPKGHSMGFIWKEINEKNIPKGIEVDPEYKKWN